MDHQARFSGHKLRQHRAAQGLSREKLAALLDTSVSTLSAYELGKMTPSADRTAALAAALGVDLADLFEHASPTGDRIAQHARAVVAGWPLLDDEQRAELRAALRPVVVAG